MSGSHFFFCSSLPYFRLLEALFDDGLEVGAHMLARRIADELLLVGEQLINQVVVVALELVSGGFRLCGGGAHCVATGFPFGKQARK